MGLMDKLKAAKSNLTGDWATVRVQTSDAAARGSTLEVTVDVTVKEKPIKIEGIVVEVRCVERIDIPSVQVLDAGTSGKSVTGRATSEETAFDEEVSAAGPQELGAGASTTATASVRIPAGAPPTFDGRFARYDWEVRARLDMKGNDPDSGWQSLQVD